MAYKILKQYQPNTATVWVEKLSADDTVETFDTLELAQARITELETADPSRKYKAVEV